MKITEIFYSCQGEGFSSGQPTVFVRLSGCNLAENCPINCDTKYSWKGGLEMNPEEVFDRIETLPHKGRICITGGEPLLQQDEVAYLCKLLKMRGYFIEIETNGTIIPKFKTTLYIDQWNISPKNEEALLNILKFQIKSNEIFIKLVINEEDYNEWMNIAEHFVEKELSCFPKDHIFLMPEAISNDEQTYILPAIFEMSKKYGFRTTCRLQILAYGNKRGT